MLDTKRHKINPLRYVGPEPVALEAGFYPGGLHLDPVIRDITGGKDYRYEIGRITYAIALDGIELLEPIPAGPKIFLTNHQTTFDLGILSTLLAAASGHPATAVVWEAIQTIHSGELALHLLMHPDNVNREFFSRCRMSQIDTYTPEGILKTYKDLEATLERGEPHMFFMASEGRLDFTEREDMSKPGTSVVTVANKFGLDIYPVRLMWAKVAERFPQKSIIPCDLVPQRMRVGRAITPQERAGLTLVEQRNQIAAAINALWIPCPDDVRIRNRDIDRRTKALCDLIGFSRTKAAFIDGVLTTPVERLSPDGRLLRRWMLDFSSHATADRRTAVWQFGLWVSEGYFSLHSTTEALEDIYRRPVAAMLEGC